jgi:hypothetical protein
MFYDTDASKRKAGVDYGRQWIDIAVMIGSPSVRQHVSGVPGAKPDIVLACESLGQLYLALSFLGWCERD